MVADAGSVLPAAFTVLTHPTLPMVYRPSDTRVWPSQECKLPRGRHLCLLRALICAPSQDQSPAHSTPEHTFPKQMDTDSERETQRHVRRRRDRVEARRCCARQLELTLQVLIVYNQGHQTLSVKSWKINNLTLPVTWFLSQPLNCEDSTGEGARLGPNEAFFTKPDPLIIIHQVLQEVLPVA